MSVAGDVMSGAGDAHELLAAIRRVHERAAPARPNVNPE